MAPKRVLDRGFCIEFTVLMKFHMRAEDGYDQYYD